MPFATDKPGGEIGVGHTKATQGRENTAQRPPFRADCGDSQKVAWRQRAVRLHHEQAPAAAGTDRCAFGRQVPDAVPKGAEWNVSRPLELLARHIDDLAELAIQLAGYLRVPAGVVRSNRDEFDLPQATGKKITKGDR